MFKRAPFVLLSSCLILLSCQTPTQVVVQDRNLEERSFSKLKFGKPEQLQRSVIVDVRSQFEHQMSRPPRSFHAYWKDWDLRGYQGERLQQKVNELQRLLSLKGVDPWTQVVILGPGLKGQGEEFLLASQLIRLGVQRIQFLTADRAREALVARGLPEVENAPAWSRPLQQDLVCEGAERLTAAQKIQKADVVISQKLMEKGGGPEQFFNKDLSPRKYRYPKSLRLRITSPNSHWAFGVALHLKEQGRQVCVL